MTIAHAVAAYWVEAESGLVEETLYFGYRLDNLNFRAEELAAQEFAEFRHRGNGRTTKLAVTQYAITVPDEIAADFDAVQEFLDRIEWFEDFRDPSVAIVRQNDEAATLFVAVSEHLAAINRAAERAATADQASVLVGAAV